MASTAPGLKVHPYGTSLELSVDGGSNYTQYYDAALISMPDETRDAANVTVIDSPNFTKESIASWIDSGKIPLEIYYSGTGAIYNTLWGYFRAGLIYYYRLKLPLLTGQSVKAIHVFQAWISKFGKTEAKEGANDVFKVKMELTIATGTSRSFTAAS